MTIAEARPFVPYAPKPLAKPAGRLKTLWLLARNPLESWTEAHFEKPMLAGPSSLFGYTVVVNDPQAVRRVLVDNVANYERDPLQLRILKTGSTGGEGLFTATGEAWRRTRRTLSPLFTPKRVAAFAPMMQRLAQQRVERWLHRRPGAILEVDREMTGVTYDILSATLFSDAIAGDSAGFERAMMQFLDAIGTIDPLDVFNAPSWLPRVSAIRARESLAFFNKTTERMVKERQAMIAADDNAPDDLLTALLRASDPETGVGLSTEDVIANLLTFIVAGHETTSRALAWTLYLLSRSPHWRAEAEAEADAASADPGNWLDEMPVIRAVFEESMRLYPPAATLTRQAQEADRLGDVDVPKGAFMVISPYLLHRHHLLWERPDTFMPERFLPEARDKIDRFAYLPFGGGQRVCIGMRFAMMEAIIVLATILRQARLSLVEGQEPRPLQRITLRPDKRLVMHIHPR
ncbi:MULTISPECIES: cytochrome P450 [unclassified Beijerinckia]|uniref:cytochrome P450 n=1 Tax=unclassified Beijerinckia TaxID=2638183 RepID=UPI00089A0F27|nr:MULTISPECIES: cytochrome P450 [unclassified Beijerinckia]MDH7799443.1 cytochrome P450 [Beijerinckia sp. GAS462]SED50633.1 Cytochrome P450 [Beijerinckia sp. 28-YEA-48]